MSAQRAASLRCKLALAAIGAVWLIMISGLMVADVWDETDALLLLAQEPVASMNFFEAMLAAWLHNLPIGFYRPVGGGLALGLGKLTGGSLLWLRYLNALLVLCSAGLLARALVSRYGADTGRAIAFFAILLFSSSSLITATWFANIFDATCLFFLALALRCYVAGRLAACGVSAALAVFCKESAALALPLFVWLLWEDLRGSDLRDRKARIGLAIFTAGVAAIYWQLRHSLIPIGSEVDIHGFDIDIFAASYASFIAGFPTQSSSFAQGDMIFRAGMAATVALVVLTRNLGPKVTLLAILGLCGPVYWGMFGYQDGNIMSYHNFVGRLYLIPFALSLFVMFAAASRPAILLLALFSVWGMGTTWRQHLVFQQTYAEIYRLAESAEGGLVVHYPEKPLEDFRRNLSIGDFPDAAVRIAPRAGGLE